MIPKHQHVGAINSVRLIVKRSIYQRFAVDEKNPALQKVLRRRQAAARTMMRQHDRHLKAVKFVQDTLKKIGVPFRTDARHTLAGFNERELVVTLGGDGTFLRTSHFAPNNLLFPVNTDTVNSVGALCTADTLGFNEKISAILAGNFTVRELPLIRVSVNGAVHPVHAVNDVLFTNVSPAATSRYRLRAGGLKERQKSSGIWISTATGSTAAIGGAGGREMPLGDSRLQFAVREPYHGNNTPYGLVHGFIAKGKSLVIVSEMVKARIFIDGPTTAFDIHYADEIRFAFAGKTLRVIG